MVIKKPAVVKGGAAKAASKFQYRPRTAEEMAKRAHQTASSREGYVISEVSTWAPSDGENKVRILPPTWDDAEHYGFEVYVHYRVGADKATYICLNKMKKEACPICEVRQDLDRAGDTEAAKEMLPTKRVATFIIDRKQESKGPLLWSAAWTLDQEIAKQATDETGKALALDSPESGYDVTFSREQQGADVPPKYVGVKIARRTSPLFDTEEEIEKTIEFVVEHPIPDCLVYHDYDAVKKVFEGGVSSAERGKEGDAPAREKPKASDKALPAKAIKKSAPEPEPEPEPEGDPVELPTWAEVHEMEEDDVTAFAEASELTFADQEFDDLAAFADWVCEQLDIAKPVIKPKVGKPTIGGKKQEAESKPAWKSKLANFKNKT